MTEKSAPLSTAEMTLPPGELPVTVGQFVELFDLNGSLGYYRVAACEQRFGRETCVRVSMEHAIATLADDLIFGTLTYPAGGASALEVFKRLLRRQSQRYWTLWTDSAFPQDLAALDALHPEFVFDDEDLLQALLHWQAALDRDLLLAFDMSRFPWRILPRALPQTPESEARLSRNVGELRLRTDRDSLCTRLYPVGAGSGERAVTIVGAGRNPGGKPYLQANTAAWGTVSRLWRQADCLTPDSLYRRAEKHLAAVQQPQLSARLDAADLAAATGEPLDRFRPGFLCRICVPEAGIAAACRILTAEHPDLVTEPGRVVLTLGAQPRRISGGGGASAASAAAAGTVTQTQTQALSLSPGVPAVLGFTVSGWSELDSVTLSLSPETETDFTLTVDGAEAGSLRGGAAISLTPLLRREGGAIARGTHTLTLLADAAAELTASITLRGRT